jgi:exonuclease 1
MSRVRLLRHYGITPYLVFDGGPLPAKKGTESERAKRREENLAKGKQLAAQGRHTQARDYFVKCVDVTPQMAYQFIKASPSPPFPNRTASLTLFYSTQALKAESVSYVVAPYEADAQLAFLERAGAISAILTEDSDLLVFGCRSVLFKLDHVAGTVTSISRADFGSVHPAPSSSAEISLLGWSDVQFRAMAILSGCDYLPSIPGVGLKTAWALLRKHKSAENAVRALRLEGKKAVPADYVDAFRRAEKVFLHQRVYDPVRERLVHLTEVPLGEGWDERCEAYVGV